MRTFVMIAALVTISALLSTNASCAPTEVPDDVATKHSTTIFFGTDRTVASATDSGKYFSSRPDRDEKIHVGSCSVLTKEGADFGSISNLSESSTPIQTLLKSELARLRPKRALIYVHGFNNSFADGIADAARLRSKLQIDGPTILWSWPSGEEGRKYLSDEDSMIWTQPHFVGFLTEITKALASCKTVAVAHSLGTRVLCLSLAAVARSEKVPPGTAIADSVILVAGDISGQIVHQTRLALAGAVSRMISYVSSHDYAIRLSSFLHSQPRGYGAVAHLPDIETVDVSGVVRILKSDDIHGYFRGNTAVSVDMLAASYGKDAQARGLKRADDGGCWILK